LGFGKRWLEKKVKQSVIWEVTLSTEQLDEIKRVAEARQKTNRGAANPDGAVITSFKADYLGAIGEKSLSVIMEKDWDGKHFSYEQWLEWRHSGGDVSGLEGKCTDHPAGRLWLREKQIWHPERPYVLLKAHNLPKVLAAGWAYGKDIHQQDYLEPGNYGKPCYYLPNNKLRTMEELVELIGKKS
jgi:hypothetical protein